MQTQDILIRRRIRKSLNLMRCLTRDLPWFPRIALRVADSYEVINSVIQDKICGAPCQWALLKIYLFFRRNKFLSITNPSQAQHRLNLLTRAR